MVTPSRHLLALLVLAYLCAEAAAAPPTVEFNRDVRPLLADACFHCHGPDKVRRKADLRLDTDAGRTVLVPGKPAASELFRRITESDAARRMPPPKSGRTLTAAQVTVLRRWIEQGGQWEKHWAFVPPKRPAAPAVQDGHWPRNGIDPFILARLEAEGLKPSSEANRVTLLRRVTLDLTGLPPTPKEVDDFLADTSPDAYEKVVERLLRSPRYGEHLARSWLDAARYADTSGYQSDGERFMWRWRDWVIDAFNTNKPFDQFTVEQIAGDLLPGATLEQKIATGFNRNHRGNAEGGIIPEEYAVEYVVDRVETTATVFLGLTLGCTRCHDHKYDPFSQKEFYRLFAYFNNVPEHGRAIKFGNSQPYIKAPTPKQQRQLAEVELRVKEAEDALTKAGGAIDAAQAKWEATFKPVRALPWAPSAGLIVDGVAAGTFRDGDPLLAPGPVGDALDLDGNRYVDAGDIANFGFYDKFSLAAWVRPDGPKGGTILSRMGDAPQADGYGVELTGGRVRFHLTKRWLDDALRVETEAKLKPGRWYHILVTCDGSRVAAGVQIYVNGHLQKLKVLLDELNQPFAAKEPLRIGAGGGPAARFHGRIDGVRVFDDRLGPDEALWLATPDLIDEILTVPPAKRTRGQAAKLRAFFLERHAPKALREADARVHQLKREREALLESFPTVMVMQEGKPRDTFVLLRGEYDKHGEKVTAGVPSVLPPLPAGATNNRLGLAKWLVDPSNPLTARVTMNRFWQRYFGTALVRTPEDFGTQGEPPSHPELLDWLATEFVRSGWDVRAMQRLIVTSAAYRQASRVSPELLRKDPDNRLLARGPRFRLSAETVRDQALAASGLLVEKVGGPSVRPYQPAGPWKELADTDYVADKGEGLYRRSLYTFWKRTVPPPNMTAFDAPARETCVVRATRTNTPLQALTLLNDVTYVEAARVLAERVMREGGKSPEERVTLAFRLATSRRPSESELRLLVSGLQRHLDTYRADAKAAEKLLAVGDARRDKKLDRTELAAYAATVGVILNLDETVTKE